MSKTETPQQRHRIAKVSLAAMVAAGSAATPAITAFAAESDQAPEPEKKVVKQTVKEQAKAVLDEAVKAEQAAKDAMDAAKAEMDQAQEKADALRAAAAEAQATMDAAETKSDEILKSAAEESAEQAKVAAAEEAAKQKAYLDVKAEFDKKAEAVKAAEQAVKDAQAEQEKAQNNYEAAGGDTELKAAAEAKDKASADLDAASKALSEAQSAFDKAQADLDTAQKKVNSTNAALEAAKSELAAAEAAVPAAEAELAKAQKDLADAEAGKETEQIKAQKAVVAQKQSELEAANADKAFKQSALETARAADEAAAAGMAAAKSAHDSAAASLAAAEKDQQDKQSAADAANKAYGDAVAKRDGAKGDLEKAQQAKSDADEKLAAAKTAKEAYESTLAWQEQAKRNGSLGFFESMGSDLAASFLKDPEKMSGVADTNTKLGASYDATDLGNMKKALETMSKINQIRKDVGMQQLEVTDSIMAIGQIQANYAAKKGNHMGLAPGYNLNTVMAVGENLAWGYPDPFVGWYDQEKAVFDKAVKELYGKTGLAGQAANDFYGENHEKIDEWVASYQATTDPYAQIGHYLAIINPVNTVYGCGYNGMNVTNEQAFSGDWYAPKTGEVLYSSDFYYQRFMQYYNKVYAAPDRSALTAAENDQAAKQQAADKANGAYSAAVTAQADAEGAQTAAAKAYQGSIDAANAAQTKRDAAQSALNLADILLQKAQTNFDAAKAEFDAKSSAAAGAKQAQQEAQEEFNEAEKTARIASSEYETESKKLDSMQGDRVAAARAQLAAAQQKKDESDKNLAAAQKDKADAEAKANDADVALGEASDAMTAAGAALSAAKDDQAKKKSDADAAYARYDSIRVLDDANTAAAGKVADAVATKDAAAEAAARAKDARDFALDAADRAKLKARAAQQCADHLAQFNVLQNRTDAFFNGIQDEWVIENEPALVDAVSEQRRIYAEAKAKLGVFARDLETALPDLSAKKAKHADATAAYNKASLATLGAQQEYDRILAAEKEAAEDAAQAEKLANAKHAKRDEAALNNDAKLVQTSDGSLLVMVGGAAVASVGAGLLANRKRKASSRD